MIAKNIKGASFSGCVNYVSKEDSELLKAEGVFAENAKSMIESFEMQRSMRAEIKQPVGHIPISFAPEDRAKMSNEFMVKLAEEYMQKMGITNTQYVIIRHHDTENEHVHVVYNRINNDLKLISVHNDYKRNVATCKELKEKYNLTFGKDKSRVKREKLHGSEAIKYAIHDIVKENLATCKDITELKIALYSSGVSMHLKCKRGSDEVQGVSFSMDEHKFKASQIDRKFSYKNLLLQLRANKVIPKLTPLPPPAPKPSDYRTIAIYGVPLTDQQRDDFYAGKAIFLKDMVMNGQTISRYVRLLDDKRHVEVAEKNIPVEVGGVRLTTKQRNDLRSDKSVMISGAKIDDEILDKLWLKYSNEQSCIMGSFRDPDAISSGNSTTMSHGQRQHLQQPSPQPQHQEEHYTQSHNDESSGALSLFDMPSSSSGADQDDIDNAEMAKNLQQKKKRGRRL